MQADQQVNVYLSAEEKAAFETYARLYLLDGAGLMALLFAREIRVGRLRALAKEDNPPDAPRRSKVTFRASAANHEVLTSHATEHRGGLSLAGATLVRAELRERWLEASITTRFESPARCQGDTWLQCATGD